VWPRWLTDALSGKASLARAFWVYGLGISVAYSLIELFIDAENPLVATFYMLVGVVLGVLQTIILWRCAYNSRSKFLGGFVRTGIVFGFIAMAIVLYVLYQFGRVAAS
jgi:hypothetical protein